MPWSSNKLHSSYTTIIVNKMAFVQVVQVVQFPKFTTPIKQILPKCFTLDVIKLRYAKFPLCNYIIFDKKKSTFTSIILSSLSELFSIFYICNAVSVTVHSPNSPQATNIKTMSTHGRTHKLDN